MSECCAGAWLTATSSGGDNADCIACHTNESGPIGIGLKLRAMTVMSNRRECDSVNNSDSCGGETRSEVRRARITEKIPPVVVRATDEEAVGDGGRLDGMPVGQDGSTPENTQ